MCLSTTMQLVACISVVRAHANLCSWCLFQVVKDCHDNGLFIFSWGDSSASSFACWQPHDPAVTICLDQASRKRTGFRGPCETCDAVLPADNDPAMYNRQKEAGVDAIIMDDVAKLTKVPITAPMIVA